MIRKITIMKRAGRLLSKIEFITLVALTVVALVVVGSGLAAAEILEIFCKASVALVNAAVAFSKALVVFSNLPVTFSDMALVAFVVLVNTPVVVVRELLSLVTGKDKLAIAFSEDKLSMNNRETRITAEIVFMYILCVIHKLTIAKCFKLFLLFLLNKIDSRALHQCLKLSLKYNIKKFSTLLC
jgi:hypothetical protein